MKKVLGLLVLCLVGMMALSSCSNDDINLSEDFLVGTWDVTYAEMDGESVDIPAGYVYVTLKDNGTYRVVMFSDDYTGRYRIEGNTVVGITLDPITEYFEFTKLDGNDAEINYSNSDEDYYRFKATKR